MPYRGESVSQPTTRAATDHPEATGPPATTRAPESPVSTPKQPQRIEIVANQLPSKFDAKQSAFCSAGWLHHIVSARDAYDELRRFAEAEFDADVHTL